MKLFPLKEQYIYQHKGVSIGVEIDYQQETISLIEKDGKRKQWIFANRTLEYMNGWQNIYTAMQKATTHATKRLQAYKDKSLTDFAELIYAVQQEDKS